MRSSSAWAGMSSATACSFAGSPPIAVVAADRRHVTIDRALRLVGIGSGSTRRVAVDDQGRMRTDMLEGGIR